VTSNTRIQSAQRMSDSARTQRPATVMSPLNGARRSLACIDWRRLYRNRSGSHAWEAACGLLVERHSRGLCTIHALQLNPRAQQMPDFLALPKGRTIEAGRKKVILYRSRTQLTNFM
jgi:hypothetical protein